MSPLQFPLIPAAITILTNDHRNAQQFVTDLVHGKQHPRQKVEAVLHAVTANLGIALRHIEAMGEVAHRGEEALQAQNDSLIAGNGALRIRLRVISDQRDEAIVRARDARKVMRAVMAEADARDAYEADPDSVVTQAIFDAAVRDRRRVINETRAAGV